MVQEYIHSDGDGAALDTAVGATVGEVVELSVGSGVGKVVGSPNLGA